MERNENPETAMAEAVTVRVVLAEFCPRFSVAGLKVQAIPAAGWQENTTLPAKPPSGAIVSKN